MFKLDGKTALVTGASSGIGRACALSLADAGARVLLAARRRDRLDEVAAKIRAERGEQACMVIELDVRERDVVEETIKSLPGQGVEAIDILVNNAGLAAGLSTLQEGSFDHWDRMVDTNVKGLLNVSRFVLPWMVERGAGHVVNIGSIAGRYVYPNGNVYCATKYAVRALNRGMRIDLHGTGIRVTTVDPGLLESEFSIVRFDGDEDKAAKVYEGTTPLSPGDVADAVLWAVTRPEHVNVEELVLWPTKQSAPTMVQRD